VSRVVARHASGGIPITASHMERYRAIFQPPTDDELRLYDPPTEHGASGPDGMSSRDTPRR
jgi:hypothetical protein